MFDWLLYLFSTRTLSRHLEHRYWQASQEKRDLARLSGDINQYNDSPAPGPFTFHKPHVDGFGSGAITRAQARNWDELKRTAEMSAAVSKEPIPEDDDVFNTVSSAPLPSSAIAPHTIGWSNEVPAVPLAPPPAPPVPSNEQILAQRAALEANTVAEHDALDRFPEALEEAMFDLQAHQKRMLEKNESTVSGCQSVDGGTDIGSDIHGSGNAPPLLSPEGTGRVVAGYPF